MKTVKEALEFYASYANYEGISLGVCPLNDDRGTVARNALAALEPVDVEKIIKEIMIDEFTDEEGVYHDPEDCTGWFGGTESGIRVAIEYLSKTYDFVRK